MLEVANEDYLLISFTQIMQIKLTNNHQIEFKSSFERLLADLLLHCVKPNVTFQNCL